jgi:hypothetical protein
MNQLNVSLQPTTIITHGVHSVAFVSVGAVKIIEFANKTTLSGHFRALVSCFYTYTNKMCIGPFLHDCDAVADCGM